MAHQVAVTRVACIQENVAYGDFERNAAVFAEHLAKAADLGVQIAVFPECFLTGYCVDSAEEARRIAITLAQVSELHQHVQRTGVTAIVGFAERAEGGIHNTAALLEPGRPLRFYRKAHLPCLGLDLHVKPGGDLPVFDTSHGRIGILICFDQRHPEAARTLMLKGADLIVLPTNWPVGAEMSANNISPVRAAENRVFMATCNRVGVENGFTFIGCSGIYDVSGKVLAKAGGGPEVILADLDLSLARQKRSRVIPGRYEWTVDESRRPELYATLTEPHGDGS